MKLSVPIFEQTKISNCGPFSLKMVLSYFGENVSFEEIEKVSEIVSGKGLSTIQIASSAKKFNFNCDFYSKYIYFDEKNMELEFYKNFAAIDLEYSKKLVEESKSLGVNIFEEKVSLEKVLSFVSKDSLVIILVDWSIVENLDKSYIGHFVPIVGYDEDYVYVHNSQKSNPEKFKKIKKEVFDKARKAKGTDEDFVVIYRKV